MKDEFSALERLARKATKGRWVAVTQYVENESDDLPDIVCNDGCRGSDADSYEQRMIDAEYIAAVQPGNVLPVIEEIRRLREFRRDMLQELSQWALDYSKLRIRCRKLEERLEKLTNAQQKQESANHR